MEATRVRPSHGRKTKYTGTKQKRTRNLVTDSAPAGCVNLHLTVTYVTYEKLAQPTCKGSI